MVKIRYADLPGGLHARARRGAARSSTCARVSPSPSGREPEPPPKQRHAWARARTCPPPMARAVAVDRVRITLRKTWPPMRGIRAVLPCWRGSCRGCDLLYTFVLSRSAYPSAALPGAAARPGLFRGAPHDRGADRQGWPGERNDPGAPAVARHREQHGSGPSAGPRGRGQLPPASLRRRLRLLLAAASQCPAPPLAPERDARPPRPGGSLAWPRPARWAALVKTVGLTRRVGRGTEEAAVSRRGWCCSRS